mmetsp:Transcript_7131/g.12282  ORF Transcript_7131/g.12282 Transcript_7131/m.12282 type:complete len:745 (-) Transcript_7131:1125-3359(-)|eukprot:CAMPEP_0119107302 /NCGR_PEP_ID=MMETSP1180-20130426/9628_1 /TAXON_ID=3052 ORGANISM="Chlamydomonas cf sp, Strain CCMP681" /NCGR_SAMPLE_ID=MMETSP1180 /ASSEMBLY_ACC=CAM_ASM_000741 /LENGTH=744 /DNA_ID=CAMNT_0007092773 /DNA_START=73 /DNA_END=2307 /DNA_ORIENTATION=-
MRLKPLVLVLLAVVAQDTLASSLCDSGSYCSVNDIGKTIASQVSHFISTELQMVLGKLAERYPDVPFLGAEKNYEVSWASPAGIQLPELPLPDFTLSSKIAVIGEVDLQVSNMRLAVNLGFKTQVNVTGNNTQLMLGFPEVSAGATFSWSWSKMGMTGSGTGQLKLAAGDIAYSFHVGQASDTGKLYFAIDQASSFFGYVELNVWSPSANWLYQVVLKLFSSQILDAVQAALAGVIQGDVPTAVNEVLATSPSLGTLDDFATKLTSLYSLAYVVVKSAVSYLLPSSCSLALINTFSLNRMPDNMSASLLLNTIVSSNSMNGVQLPGDCSTVEHQAVAMLPLLGDAVESVAEKLRDVYITPDFKACQNDLASMVWKTLKELGSVLSDAALNARTFSSLVSHASQLWKVVSSDTKVPRSCVYLIVDDEAAVFLLDLVKKLVESYAPSLLGLDLTAVDAWSLQEMVDGVKGAITPQISALWSPFKAMVPEALLCGVKMPAVVYNALTNGSPTLLSQLQGLGVLPTAPGGLEPVATCVEDMVSLASKALGPIVDINLPTISTPAQGVLPPSVAMSFAINAADYARLKSDSAALDSFVRDAAAAIQSQLRSRAKNNGIVVKGTAQPLARRRQLLASTVIIDFIITSPTGTEATALLATINALVADVNANGMAALGNPTLGGIQAKDIGVAAAVTSTGLPPTAKDTSSSGPNKKLIIGLAVGIGGGVILIAALAAVLIVHMRKKGAVAPS